MKIDLTLTFALLVFPLAACVAQAGSGEEVNATDQEITAATVGQPEGHSAKTTEPRVDTAKQFTTSTVIDPPRELSSDEGDPTTPKKVDGVQPIPNPWDPTKITKR